MALSLENEERGSSLSRDLSPSITAVTSGYTPGPWRIDWRNQGSFAIRAAGKTVCAGNYVYTPAPLAAHHANARLISAAPDLLAELKWCFMGAGSLQRMAAAIAKAEGLAPPVDISLSGSKAVGPLDRTAPRDTPKPSSPPEDEHSKLSGGWENVPGLRELIAKRLSDHEWDGTQHWDWKPQCYRDQYLRKADVVLSALPQDHAPVRGREGSVDLQTNVALQCADPQAGRSGGEP